MDLNSKVFFNFFVSLFVSQSRTVVYVTEYHGGFTESRGVFFCFTEYHGGFVSQSRTEFTQRLTECFFVSLRYSAYYSVEHCETFFQVVVFITPY